jgi:hypothetical protein
MRSAATSRAAGIRGLVLEGAIHRCCPHMRVCRYTSVFRACGARTCGTEYGLRIDALPGSCLCTIAAARVPPPAMRSCETARGHARESDQRGPPRARPALAPLCARPQARGRLGACAWAGAQAGAAGGRGRRAGAARAARARSPCRPTRRLPRLRRPRPAARRARAATRRRAAPALAWCRARWGLWTAARCCSRSARGRLQALRRWSHWGSAGEARGGVCRLARAAPRAAAGVSRYVF